MRIGIATRSKSVLPLVDSRDTVGQLPMIEQGPTVIHFYRRHQIRLVVLLLVSYIGFYFCRVTLVTSLPQLQDDFDYSRQQVGQIASYYLAVYAVAKLFNGILGARLAPKILLLLGVSGSVACNIAFSYGHGLTYFSTVWSVNAFFQSMGWIALVGIVSQWFAPAQSGKALATISISYLFGDTIARASAGLILEMESCSWRELFWIHSLVFVAVGLAAAVFLRPNPESAGLPSLHTLDVPIPERDHEHSTQKQLQSLYSSVSRTQLIVQLLKNLHFWVVCVIYLCLSMIRYAFWIWSVVYLKEECGLTLGKAALTSAVLPLAGSLGALVAGFGSDSPNPRRGPVLAVMTGALLVALIVFMLVPKSSTGSQIAALGFVGFVLIGPYSLIAGAIAVDFGSTRLAATASGMIDSVGALGAIVMGVGMGALVDRSGWNAAFGSLIAIGAVAFLLCLSLWKTTFESVNKTDT